MSRIVCIISVFLVAALFSFCLKADNKTLTVKIKNGRSDATEKIYIQPNNKCFYYYDNQKKKTMLEANKNFDLSKLPTVPEDTSTYLLYVDQASDDSHKGLRVYFSIGDATLAEKKDHSCDESGMDKIRFDWIEATPDGTAYSCINLTSLEQLGICFSLKSYKNNALVESLGWNKSLEDIATAAKTSVGDDVIQGKIGGKDFIRVKGAHNYQSLWSKGIEDAFTSVKGQTISIIGFYVGSDADKQQAAFNFSGTFDSTGKNITLTGSFTDKDGNALIKDGKMEIKNISVDAIFKAVTGGTTCTVTCYNGTTEIKRAVDANDKWECLFNYLMTGFNTGFWCDATTRSTVNWTSDAQFKGSGNTYNKYSALIHNNSNSYGDPYSDNVQDNKVQLNLTPANVDTLLVTILDDKQVDGYTRKASSFPGYEITCPSTTKQPLQSIIFNDDPSTAMAVKQGVVQFPSSIKRGGTNKLSLIFAGDAGATQKTTPFIKVYMPESPIGFDPKKNPVDHTGWSIGGNTDAADSMFVWQPIKGGTMYWNLTLSADVQPANFNPDMHQSLKYEITCPPVIGLQSVIFGTGKPVQVINNMVMLDDTVKLDAYNKISFVYDPNETVHPYIWVYLPKNISENPNAHPIHHEGWNIPGDADKMFNWVPVSGNPHVSWNLPLSGNVIPKNFDPKKAEPNPPLNSNADL